MYLLKYEDALNDSDFSKYSQFNTKVAHKIEFYDFVLLNLCNFLLKIFKKNQIINEHIYFLSSCLLDTSEKPSLKYRARLAYDLLLEFGAYSRQSSDYLIYVSNLYELEKTNQYVKSLLVELVANYFASNTKIIKSLETHLVAHNSVRSYSLLSEYFIGSSHLTTFRANILLKAVQLYANLVELIKTLSKTKTSEQIWIRKVIAFIETNNSDNEILLILANLESNYDELSQESCESLLNKIVQFVQMPELDNLLKYFEAARENQIDDTSIHSQMVQRLGSSVEYLTKIYAFVADSVNIYTCLFMKKCAQDWVMQKINSKIPMFLHLHY